MSSRIVGAVALLLAASSAWGFQVQAVWDDQPRTESVGFQTIRVDVTRDPSDPPTVCQVDVTAAGQAFANPAPNAATVNVDFTPTTANLSFTIGANDTTVSQTFNVPVLDDNLREFDVEEFAAVVLNATSPDCGSPVFSPAAEDPVPISDDDTGNVTLSVDQPSIVVNEDAGTVAVTVSVGGASSVEPGFFIDTSFTVVPNTATTPADYTGALTGSLSFNESTLTQTVTLSIVDDAVIEPTEDFSLVISNVFSGLANEDPLQVTVTGDTATVQIADNDSPGELAFGSEPFTVDETAQNAIITLQRINGTAGTFTAFYQTADGSATAGSDYQAVSGSVTWADGDGADKTFTVPILDDAEGEGDETVLVRASTDPSFVEFLETTLTINDDEGLATTSFSATTATVAENDDQVVLTLVRGGGTAGIVTVDYATADGTAIAGQDYVAAAGTVTWADGDNTDKTVTIQLIQDNEEEGAEEFLVNLSNVTGAATLGSNSTITVAIDADATRNIAEIPNLTPNQAALARFFDQTCSRLAQLGTLTPAQQELLEVCGLLRNVDTDDATVRDALDAINPEELLVSTFNALRLTGVQHGNLSQRLNGLRNGATGISLTGLNLEVDGQQIAGNVLQEVFDRLIGGGASADEYDFGRWGAFVNGRIATGDQDKSENEAAFDFDLYAVTAGVDYRIKPNFIVGVSAGFGSVDADFDRQDGGINIDSWNVGTYLTYFREESFYVDALATYGRNDYDSRRRVSVAAGGTTVFERIGRGKTDGNQFSLGLGSGWDFNRGGLTFGPHFGGYFFDVEVDGFAETGGGGLDIAVDDQSTQSLTINAGGHLSYAWLTDWGVLVPNAKVDWVHEFEDDRETLTFRFLNDPFAGDPSDPTPSITLQSNRPDTNYFIWSVGMSAQLVHGFSGFVNYQSYAGYGGVSLDEWSFGGRWEKTF